MKEAIIALMIGLMFIFELLILIKADRYVYLIHTADKDSLSKEDKAKRTTMIFFGMLYLIFMLLGMAMGTLWYIYGSIFLLSILTSPVFSYFRKQKAWSMFTMVKRIDCALTLILIAWLFLEHFHPGIINY